jgi:hypothetical protein
MSYAGVMPLHLAVECGHPDLVCYLLHWGASRTRLDGSRLTALQTARLREKRKATKDSTELNAELIRLLTDEQYLAKRVEGLLPRLDAMRVLQKAELKSILYRQAFQLGAFSVSFLLLASVLVAGAPDRAEAWLGPTFVGGVRQYLPLTLLTGSAEDSVKSEL